MEAYLTNIGTLVLDHVLTAPFYVLSLEVLCVFSILFILDVINVLVLMYFVPKKPGYSHHVGGEKSILVAGDSTAVGTGAKDPSKTLAGFLAHDFPSLNVENVAVNGAKTRAVRAQLEAANGGPYESILISIGGNDVWTFTSLRTLKKDLLALIAKAKEMSNGKVFLIFFGNEGSAPFFPALFRKILMWRTWQVLALFRKCANDEAVPLIELFTKKEENPFVKNPKAYFALDGLHPSEAGYWEWYKRLWRFMSAREYHIDTRIQ